MISLSKSEKEYILDGINQNIRIDGRERLDFRSFVVETGVVSNANGSARVKLSNTDVLVGIKLEIGEVTEENPDEGRIQLNVECSPGLPGEKNLKYLKNTFFEILTNSINLSKFCVLKGSYCWVIYIDCLILDTSGNNFDALGLCIRSALYDTKIPHIEFEELENGTKHIVLNEDPNKIKRFNSKELPLAITFIIFSNRYVVDPTLEEEACGNTSLTISVNSEGKIFSIHKKDFFGINPSYLIQILKSAEKIGKFIIKKVDNILIKESEITQETFLK